VIPRVLLGQNLDLETLGSPRVRGEEAHPIDAFFVARATLDGAVGFQLVDGLGEPALEEFTIVDDSTHVTLLLTG
jgi:hypothetical protein